MKLKLQITKIKLNSLRELCYEIGFEQISTHEEILYFTRASLRSETQHIVKDAQILPFAP